jgi:hypothetical protein
MEGYLQGEENRRDDKLLFFTGEADQWALEDRIRLKLPKKDVQTKLFSLTTPLQYNQGVCYCWQDAQVYSHALYMHISWPQPYWKLIFTVGVLQFHCFSHFHIDGCRYSVMDQTRTNHNVKGMFTQAKYLCQNIR